MKKNKNPDDNNKNIDEQLVEKNCSFSSDDKVCFTQVVKSDTESSTVNKNDDISPLIDSLNGLTMSESVNSDISNPTAINNILPKVRSMVLYHNADHNSWNKALIISRAGKVKSRNNSWFNV